MEKGILGANTIQTATRLMKANFFTCPELVEAAYKNIESKKHLNAFVSVRDQSLALKEAEQS